MPVEERAARRRRVFLAVRRDDRTHLLTPILHCASCGETLRGKAARRENAGACYCHYGSTEASVRSSGLDPAVVDVSHDAAELEDQALGLLNGIRLSGSVVSRLNGRAAERIRTRPENAATQAEIDDIRRQQERLRDTYVLGDTTRDAYLLQRSGFEKQIRQLERRLGGPDYPLEDTLARVNRLGSLLSTGTPGQQERALSLLFRRIDVSLHGGITEVEPQPWAEPLFSDLAAVTCDNECPQGNSNPCRRLERAVS